MQMMLNKCYIKLHLKNSTFTFASLYNLIMSTFCVATLALGSWPKQGLAKVWAKKETWESHLMLPWV
jgi:hypothetical protein